MMTQTEYENQDFTNKVLHQPKGSVVIENYRTWKSTYMEAGKWVEVRYYQVTCMRSIYDYRTNPKYDNGTLYTMDDDGNIKSPSVFREPWEVSGGKI